MTLNLLKRSTTRLASVASRFRSCPRSFCTRAPTILLDKEEPTQMVSVNNRPSNISGILLSPLFSADAPRVSALDIELVDDDAWQVSSGLANAWRGLHVETGKNSHTDSVDERAADDFSLVEGDPDFDDIDNMRIRGNLFYKIDRASKEFEEYSFEFHRKKSSKRQDDHKESEKKKECSKNKVDRKDRKENLSIKSVCGRGKLPRVVNNDGVGSLLSRMEGSCLGKKIRTPTFNQLTGPYHEPFCLDIFISKASVRACIIHRVTSKVVAVAHSISKDMKFDLASTRNYKACVAVGEILAQRALADDVHDVVYTPRKGDELEGKLQAVLQAIINNGVNVKVKLKQKKTRKTGQPSTT